MKTTLTPYELVRFRIYQMSTSIHNIKLTTYVQHKALLSPKLPCYQKYRGMKFEASVWLTALKILKVLDQNPALMSTTSVLEVIRNWGSKETAAFLPKVTSHVRGLPKAPAKFKLPNDVEDIGKISEIVEAKKRLLHVFEQVGKDHTDQTTIMKLKHIEECVAAWWRSDRVHREALAHAK